MEYVLYGLTFHQMIHWFDVAIDIENPSDGIVTVSEAEMIVNHVNDTFTWNEEQGRFV